MTILEHLGSPRSIEQDWGRPLGPSDKEVVTVLRRVASARAHLALARRQTDERRAAAARPLPDDVERAIRNAHSDVLWAQAALLGDRRQEKVRRELDAAVARERIVLRRHGFSSFQAYLSRRDHADAGDVHLEHAWREFRAATRAWEDLQAEFAPTVILDLTGDEPRLVD